MPAAAADPIVDWSSTACEIAIAARFPPPPTYRVMALVQTAVYEAVNGITRRYPADGVAIEADPNASVPAAIAAANRAVLAKLAPSQQAAIDSATEAALALIPDGPSKVAGVAAGERAAAAVLAQRADDGGAAAESYRPQTAAGVYTPTVIPIASTWPRRKPWVMASPDQFRPGPPPSLASELWARDYNEIKALGGKSSTQRSAEQTAIARFWEATAPPVYFSLLTSVASAPGREVTQNARFFAVASQAMDDALIAVFDGKYHYAFWRPITAIRNGDADGNDATERDVSWAPFIDTPMHPEYPCAHCILAAAVGVVLEAEIGSGPTPRLTSKSPLTPGLERSFARVEDFVQEVANARIWDGVHYRNSTEVGSAMGKKVGELAVAKCLRPRD
jgi:hypothetical protein